MRRTAYLDHPDFMGHRTGPRHPERPARLEAIRRAVEGSSARGPWIRLDPRRASREDLERVHTPAYLDHLESQSATHRYFLETEDTPGSTGTWPAALRAAGAVMTAIDAVVEGAVDNAFCAVRPPGHHAGAGQARGFCFINSIAVGARYAQCRRGLGRVAILDWDAHHGNGTQEIFEEDGSVLLCGTHQYPLYPGSGRVDECGRGKGRGCMLNRPLARGSTDTDLNRIYEEDFAPAIRNFRPDLILISAGFDGLAGDPLANLVLTPAGLGAITRRIRDWADEWCGGRVISVLEGGYELENLAAGVVAHLEGLRG